MSEPHISKLARSGAFATATKGGSLPTTVLIFLCFILCFHICGTCAFAQASLSGISLSNGAKDVRIPLLDEDGQTAGYLSVGEIGFEKRRIGPLRLGVLQKLILSDVEVEVAPGIEMETCLKSLGQALSRELPLPGASMRRFVLQAAFLKTRLQAEEASFSAGDCALMLKGVEIHATESSLKTYPSGRLELQGTAIGTLLLKDPMEGRIINSILGKQ